MPIANTNAYRLREDGAMEVVTRKGDVFLIDAEDEGISRRHCWSRHEHGYARAVTRLPDGKMKTVYLHRLICPTTDEKPHVDHISGDQADCRRANLRSCSRDENQWNQKRRCTNASGYKGVSLHPSSGLYRARVTASGVTEDRGLFRTPEEAAAAAAMRRKLMHGEFARHE